MKISDNSSVSISLLGGLLGMAFWVGTLSTRLAVAESEGVALAEKHEEAMKELKKVNENLAKIQGFLESRF